MNWPGICFAGIGQAFELHIAIAVTDWAVRQQGEIQPFKYLEIGVADGATLTSAYRHLTIPEHLKRCTGVDIQRMAFEPMMNAAADLPLSFSNYPMVHRLGVCFCEAKVFLAGLPDRDWSFALIDGCHGRQCVMADFLGLEDRMAHGGIVAFHDSMPEDQGQDMQPHCNEPINVRAAITELGLLSAGGRPGWKLLSEVHGDKNAPTPGNGMSFFQRT